MTIALVTGGTRGLGKAIATRLSDRGWRVVIAGRDAHKADLVADLSRLDDVRRLAAEVKALYPDLMLLVNNAGVSKGSRVVTPDGLETTFATNHLAPFLLTNLLLPSKVINIASEQHRFVRAIPWDDLQGERRFRPIEQYSLTKLYNVLFTRELARRAAGRVQVNAVSPGFLRTDLGREARGGFRVFLTLAQPFQQPPEKGAESLMPVLDSELTGAYFRSGKQVVPSALAQDEDAGARLWKISRELSGLGLD